MCLGLVGAILLVYGQVATHEFMAFDDPAYVVENPWVNSGLDGPSVVWAFTQFHSQNWHPVTWLSHMLDVELFGLHAGAHLLVNVAFHAGATLLLLLALVRSTGALWPSAIVAALFALHPLRAESVAWVSERKDVLGAFFFCATLLCHARYAVARTLRNRIALVVVFALGLMSKPMLVTTPFVLLLLDYWPLERTKRESLGALVLEKLPLLLLCAASSVVTLLAQRAVVSDIATLPLSLRAANAVVSYVAYLFSAIWPLQLAFFYPHPAIEYGAVEGRFLSLTLVCGAILVVLTALSLRWFKTRPYLAVGFAWYVGMLVPVIGLVQVGVQARADRYTYLPMIGALIAVVWGLRELAIRRGISRNALRLPVLVVLLLYAGLCFLQVGTWKNRASVAIHAIRVTSNNYVAHNELGVVLEEMGRTDEARQQYELALAAYPGFSLARSNLGNVLLREGDLTAAEAAQRGSLAADPGSIEARVNLAITLARQDRTQEALDTMEEAVALAPDNAGVHFNHAVLLERSGRIDEATHHYREAVRLRPGYVDARSNLATLLGKSGDLDGAETELLAALEVDPAHAKSLFNYAVVLSGRGDLVGAMTQLERVLEVEPDNEAARRALEQIRAKLQ